MHGTYLWKALQALTYVFDWIYFTQYRTFFFSIDHLFSSLSTVFDSISSNIDENFSINASANFFVFEDFNVHHNDGLTYSGGTYQPGELCYNFSMSNVLTQIVSFPT